MTAQAVGLPGLWNVLAKIKSYCKHLPMRAVFKVFRCLVMFAERWGPDRDTGNLYALFLFMFSCTKPAAMKKIIIWLWHCCSLADCLTPLYHYTILKGLHLPWANSLYCCSLLFCFKSPYNARVSYVRLHLCSFLPPICEDKFICCWPREGNKKIKRSLWKRSAWLTTAHKSNRGKQREGV